jgi:hypothetical protein
LEDVFLGHSIAGCWMLLAWSVVLSLRIDAESDQSIAMCYDGIRKASLIMSGQSHLPEILPRHFAPTQADRRRWRRVAEWSGDRTFKLLKQIEAARVHATGSKSCSAVGRNWLLPYRAEFRRTIQFGRLESIKLYLADCPAEMIPVGVWLWARCADRFRLYGLSAFCNDRSPLVRRHVAKALRRLEAWALLDEMAAAYPDDARIQWFAHAHTTRRTFSERLANFSRNVDDSHADEVSTPSRMPFWALERSWEYTAPKSVALIRRMLRRIRHWVRWGVS